MAKEQSVSELARKIFAETYVDEDSSELAPIVNIATELRESGISRREILEQLYSFTQNACLVVYLGNVARLNRDLYSLPKISDLRKGDHEQIGVELSDERLSQLGADPLITRITNAFGVDNQKTSKELTDLQLFGRVEFTNAMLLSLKAAERVEEVESIEGLVYEGYSLYEEMVKELDKSPIDAIRQMFIIQDEEHLWELKALAEVCLSKEDIKAITSIPAATT